VKSFIPDAIPPSKLLLMPASTDLCDGLNKGLTQATRSVYWAAINQIGWEQGGGVIDFWGRCYITQVARFDPSKGIPDVLKSYLHLRRLMENHQILHSKIPQLLITGVSSVDDPDGDRVYVETMEMLDRSEFRVYRQDIAVVRLPPEDRLLNAVTGGARVSLQLSLREGKCIIP